MCKKYKFYHSLLHFSGTRKVSGRSLSIIVRLTQIVKSPPGPLILPLNRSISIYTFTLIIFYQFCYFTQQRFHTEIYDPVKEKYSREPGEDFTPGVSLKIEEIDLKYVPINVLKNDIVNDIIYMFFITTIHIFSPFYQQIFILAISYGGCSIQFWIMINLRHVNGTIPGL